MPSDFGERRSYPPPAQAEQLPCPRCDSTNTKFCYYNNYNLSQPRHFCKACRRYWTHGGTLRNIPVGGTTRKPSKRSRPSSSASSAAIAPSFSANPISGPKSEMLPCDVNLNDSVSAPGSFSSLLGSGGFLALGGYGMGGVGPSPCFDDLGPYGFGGRGIWAFPEVGHVPESGGGASAGWQVNGVECGMVDGECFAWSELAISIPGQGLKLHHRRRRRY